MASYQLAQLNVAHLVAPIDSPTLADFVARLDGINALAEGSPGFVWRYRSDLANPSALLVRAFGDDVIPNMSVWTSIDALHGYVYRSAHTEVMARRSEWFHRMRDAWHVLWWVPEGHRPTLAEAHERLELLRANGPGPQAFTFKRPMPAPGDRAASPAPLDDLCPAD